MSFLRRFFLLVCLTVCCIASARADGIDTQVDKVQEHFVFRNPDNTGIPHDDLKRILLTPDGNSNLLKIGLYLAAQEKQRDKLNQNIYYEAKSELNADMIWAAVGAPGVQSNPLNVGIDEAKKGLTNLARGRFPVAVEAFEGYNKFLGLYGSTVGKYQDISKLINAVTERGMANSLNKLVRDYDAYVVDPNNDSEEWSDLRPFADPIQSFLDNKTNKVKSFDVHEFCKENWRVKRQLNSSAFSAEVAAYRDAVKSVIGAGPQFSVSALYAPGTATFDASGSSGRYGQAVSSYRWFIDGQAAGNTVNISRTFWQTGSYTVTLFVTDTDGIVQENNQIVNVYPPYIRVSIDAVRRTATFDVASNPLVTEWKWEFGDGANQVGANLNYVTHSYTADGRYAVKLTLKTSGNTEVVSETVADVRVPTPTTYTLTGGAGGNWRSPSNWSPYGVPGELDTAIIENGNVNTSDVKDIEIKSLQFRGGSITGDNALIVTGYSIWTGGYLLGTLNVPSGATLTLPPLSGTSVRSISGTLNNAGSVVMQPTTNDAPNNSLSLSYYRYPSDLFGRVNNSGTWTVQGSSPIYGKDGSLFNNTGTLLKTGEDSAEIQCPLNNSGTINVQSGYMNLGKGQHSGTLVTAAGAGLNLYGPTLNTGTTINGAGKVVNAGYSLETQTVLNGTVTVNGTVEIFGKLQSNDDGKFVGPGVVNWTLGEINGTLNLAPGSQSQVPTFNWTGGYLLGTLNVPSGATLTLPPLSGTSVRSISGTLNNAGSVVMQPTTNDAPNNSLSLSYYRYPSDLFGRVNNSGTWTVQGSSPIYGKDGSLFNNTGTLLKTGEDSAEIQCPLDNSGTVKTIGGNLSFSNFSQISGATLLAGGSLGIYGTWNLNGGVLAGSGDVYGTIINSGAIVRPGDGDVGTINVKGDYTQSGTGALELQLGGTASDKFDRLLVSGTATLGGNVNVAYVNAFVPAVSDKFAVVTHQTRSGQFAKVNAAALPDGRSLGAVYNANDVTLQTIGINPPTLNPTLTPASPKTNDTLTVAPNGDASSYAYVWKKNGTVISGESTATLNLGKAGNGDKNDVITVEVTGTNASGGTTTAVAQVTVVNSAPIAISSQGVVDHDTEKGFVLNAYDADGDALTYKRVGGPRNGVLADIRVDPTDGKTKLFYKSRVRYGGVDIIRFVVFDSDNKQSNESTLGITVLYTPPPPVNRAPVAGNTFIDTYVNTSVIKGLLGSDPDGDPITFRIVNNAKYGKSEIKQDKDGLFKLFYTSLNRFYGNDRVTYIAVDKHGKESNIATVGINFINRSPVAQGNKIGVATGAPVSQYLFGTDEDGDALTYRLVNNPRYGKGEVKRDGQGLWRFFYQSLPGYVGPDQITFIAIDPMGKESSVAAIDINVIRISGAGALQSGAAPSGGGS